jgi:hypothetical protein
MTPWDSTRALKAANDVAAAPKCDHMAMLLGFDLTGGRIYWCSGCGAFRIGKAAWNQPKQKGVG